MILDLLLYFIYFCVAIQQNDNDIEKVLSADNETDVFKNLLENHRYLVIPKSWAVLELPDDDQRRCLVIFNPYILKEKNTLITVIRKSITISEGALLNYSIHGLPVNIKGTILPPKLDNIKKLLSILHLFDKMQVCSGLGDDLGLLQSDSIVRDNCRCWRHKNCKILLTKSDQCTFCTKINHFCTIIK